MKTYNKLPASSRLHINKDCRVYKTSDDKMCAVKGLNSLDFILWYDEKLLSNFVDFAKNPFSTILQFIYNKDDTFIVHSNNVRNNYRLACLIYHYFVNCDADKVKTMSQEYLNDHPEISLSGRNYEQKIDWDSILNYDRVKANRLIFPFFRKKDIEIPLISELLSRELLSFDNKFRNLVFICRDSYSRFGVEKHGITDKHFMRLEGKKFPFVYWFEREEKRNFKDFKNILIYSDTIEMLEELSTLRCSGGIDLDTLYVSVHTSNFSEYCLENLLELCSDDVNIKYTFNIPSEQKKKLNPDEKVLPEKNGQVRPPEIDVMEENLRIYFKDDSIKFSGIRHYDNKEIYYSERYKIYYDKNGKLDDDDLPF